MLGTLGNEIPNLSRWCHFTRRPIGPREPPQETEHHRSSIHRLVNRLQRFVAGSNNPLNLSLKALPFGIGRLSIID